MNTWYWIKTLKKAILFRFVNFLLIGGMGLLIASVFSDLTGSFLNGNYENMGLFLIQLLLAMFVVSFVIPVLQYKEGNLMETEGGEADIIVFREFLKQDYSMITEKDRGMYMNVLWNDFPAYRVNLACVCSFVMAGVVTVGVSFVMAGVVTVGVSFAVTACYSGWFALLTVVTSTIAVLVPFLFQRKMEQKKEKSMETFLEYAIHAIMLLIEISIYALGCVLVFEEQIDYAMLVKIVMIASVTKSGVGWLLEGAQSIHELRSAQKDFTGSFSKGKRGKRRIEKIERITAREVKFSYAEGKRTIVFPKMEFEEGKVYFLRGANGAGKSTFLKLLMGFYTNYQGSIAVNGTELKKVSQESWYEHVTYISQNPMLFHLSVKQNLLLGNPKADPTLYKTLLKAFRLEELENKELDFGREGISGGERQSISIVRALLRNPQFILVDEPLNTLDSDRKDAFLKYMEAAKNVTFLVISHQDFESKRDSREILIG